MANSLVLFRETSEGRSRNGAALFSSAPEPLHFQPVSPPMSIVGLILVAQAAAVPAAEIAPPPDIEIRAHADIRSLKIRSEGTAHLDLHAEPGGAPPVLVERSAPAGSK